MIVAGLTAALVPGLVALVVLLAVALLLLVAPPHLTFRPPIVRGVWSEPDGLRCGRCGVPTPDVRCDVCSLT